MKTILSFLLLGFSIATLHAQTWVWGVNNTGGKFGAGTIFKLDVDNQLYETVHDFHPEEGGFPYAPLFEAKDGHFYGTTVGGGENGTGAIFRISRKGDFIVLKHFDLCDGANPFGGLVEGANNMLYGMTTDGGNNGFGTIYRIGTDGNHFQVLWHFSSNDGARPEGALIRGEDGAFYGMTSEGGRYGMGTMFRFTGDAGDLSIFHHFEWSDGAYPYGSILENCDGKLFGVTHCGGKNNVGTAFSIDRTGQNFKVLHHFDLPQGGHPYSDLIEGCDGVLYGTTNLGGQYQGGVVFRINTDGKEYRALHHLNYAMDGASPQSSLREDNGVLYGTTSYGGKYWGGTVFRIGTDGKGFAVLQQLNPEEGQQPFGALTIPHLDVPHPTPLEHKTHPVHTTTQEH